MLSTIPDLMSIHPMSLELPDEEITVVDLRFISKMQQTFLLLLSYAKWLETADHQSA